MSARPPLLSRDWYRVAAMRPRLRRGVRVSRQRVRGETWYVLSDPVSGRHHRFNDIAYALIASCDGDVTLDAAWAARVAAEGDAAPSQAETIRIVAQAFAANLLCERLLNTDTPNQPATHLLDTKLIERKTTRHRR